MSRALKTADDLRRRATYLAEVVDQLYPGAGGNNATRPYIIVPGKRRPRVLIPAADRKVAAAALMRYARPAARGARFKRDAAVWALRLGLDRLLLPHRVKVGGDEGIDDHLAAVLGHEVHLSIHIGPTRANRKPVLQILDGDAKTVAFAKLGVNPLTRELVDAETAATRRLSEFCDLKLLRVPAAPALRELERPQPHGDLRAPVLGGPGRARALPQGRRHARTRRGLRRRSARRSANRTTPRGCAPASRTSPNAANPTPTRSRSPARRSWTATPPPR